MDVRDSCVDAPEDGLKGNLLPAILRRCSGRCGLISRQHQRRDVEGDWCLCPDVRKLLVGSSSKGREWLSCSAIGVCVLRCASC